jgi:hypothetical protein
MVQRVMLTTKQAAAYLGTTTGTMRQWRHTGYYNIPHIKSGINCYYSIEALDEFKANRLLFKAKSKPEILRQAERRIEVDHL